MPLGAVAISAVTGRWICPWELVAMSLVIDVELVMPWESLRSSMVMLDGQEGLRVGESPSRSLLVMGG